MPACAVLKEPLFGAVVRGTCQTREVYQEWYFMNWICSRLRREVQIEGHLAADSRGIVRKLQELSPE